MVQELCKYQEKGIEHIWFADEIISAADLDLLSQALLEQNIQIRYGAMLRPTKDFTYEVLGRMYDAGFRAIIWGVESTSQRILDLMKKGTNVQDMTNVLRWSSDIGLSNIAASDVPTTSMRTTGFSRITSLIPAMMFSPTD